MQALMKLTIVNQEVIRLFQRKLKKHDNYFERVFVKLSLLIKDALLSNAYALATLYEIHDEVLNLSAYFDDEVDKFEGQLEKKGILDLKKINFIAKYDYDFPCHNIIACALSELIEVFDKLVSILKLLHLSGLLESRQAFYQLKQRYQKKLNTLLSTIILTPSAKHHSLSVEDIITKLNKGDDVPINLNSVLHALDAPYSPGLSKHQLSNLKFKLKKHILPTPANQKGRKVNV